MAALQSISDDIEIARELAHAAHEPALRYFRSDALKIDNKRVAIGGFDPVTAADREIETIIREILRNKRPDDGILGEEHENTVGESGRTWVIDPIDGTRAFMCGLPTWGVLIALNDGTRPILGLMEQPFTGEQYLGVTAKEHPLGVCRQGGTEIALRSRRCTTLGNAVMCSTAPDAFKTDHDLERFTALSEQTRLTRFGTDCYAYAMIARGQIDLVVESGLKPYDIQAMIPIVEAAGGIVTNWNGGPCHDGGQVIAACNTELHAQAIQILGGVT